MCRGRKLLCRARPLRRLLICNRKFQSGFATNAGRRTERLFSLCSSDPPRWFERRSWSHSSNSFLDLRKVAETLNQLLPTHWSPHTVHFGVILARRTRFTRESLFCSPIYCLCYLRLSPAGMNQPPSSYLSSVCHSCRYLKVQTWTCSTDRPRCRLSSYRTLIWTWSVSESYFFGWAGVCAGNPPSCFSIVRRNLACPNLVFV